MLSLSAGWNLRKIPISTLIRPGPRNTFEPHVTKRGGSISSPGSAIVEGSHQPSGEPSLTGAEGQSPNSPEPTLCSEPLGAVDVNGRPVTSDGRWWLPQGICPSNGTGVAKPIVAIEEGQSRIQKKTAFQVAFRTFGRVVGQATAPRQPQLAPRLQSWDGSVRGYGGGLMKTVAIQLPAGALRVMAAAYQEGRGRLPNPRRMFPPEKGFARYIGNVALNGTSPC